MHALWALIGAGPLEPGFHAPAARPRRPRFRAWGVRAAGNMRTVEPAIRDQVVALAGDPRPTCRLQVAIAARKLEGVDPLPVLLDVLAPAVTTR